MADWLRRRLGLVAVAAVVLVLLFANRIATFLTDLWWFEALGFRNVFTTLLGTQIGLGVVFGLVLGVLVAVNLLITRRLRPLFMPSSPQEAAVQRYREMADPYLPWLIAGIAVLFAVTSAFAVSAQWDLFLLWQHGQPFGTTDPQFDRDIGYYLFDLPWWRFVQSWLFTSLLLVGLLTAGAHYLLGGIRTTSDGITVLPKVKAHLSVLLALLLLVRGWGYWLDRFMLNFSPRGTVTGASYTDVNAELPALNLLLIVTAVAIVLVLYGIRRRGWLLPGAALGLLVAASVILQGAYPAVIQRLRVDPQELAREGPFIERNLEATRTAYDLPTESPERFRVDRQFSEQEREETEVTLQNIRLWDPPRALQIFEQFQELRPYYEFQDVDIDRYEVDGTLRQVTIGAREVGFEELPQSAQTWQNIRTFYTHGYGVAANLVNTALPSGRPEYLASDIPPQGADPLVSDERGSRIYYGEESGGPQYSLVRLRDGVPELDYEDPDTNEQTLTVYDGEGGVPTGNLFRRLAHAVRFADPNLVLSDLIVGESRVIHRRNVQERVRAVAPYLQLDRDPYPVVLDGEVTWIQDAYTTSRFYPYSERRSLNVAPGNSRVPVNYARNSVKAVVDAQDGTVTLYVVEPDDPVVQTWQEAFPGPYEPLEAAPEGLREHFRYPEGLFTLQSDLYRTYHIEGAGPVYNKGDAWAIPPDAAAIENQGGEVAGASTQLRPYYLLMRLPGEQDEEFVLIQPYLPEGRPNLVGWLAGRSDPDNYGELFPVRFPTNQQVLGPAQAQANLESDNEIAQYITLRDQAGSELIRGNLLALPVANSMMYIEPLFLINPQAEIPELARVVVMLGDEAVMEPTLEGALDELIGGEQEDAGDPGEQPEDGDEQAPPTGSLLQQALERFQQAQTALEAGDLGTYQERIEQARSLLEQAAEEEGVQLQPTPAPTATPGGPQTAGPTPTPGGG